MQRRETFATTGTRLTIRFFGGYDFNPADAGARLVKAGYAKGVPMGADLKAPPQGSSPPFLIAAFLAILVVLGLFILGVMAY